MLRFKITLGVLLISISAFAQQKIDGLVRQRSGQPLAGATIKAGESSRLAVSDDNGRFQFARLPEGNLRLQISYVGFQAVDTTILLPQSSTIVITMDEASQVTEEVIVQATRATDKIPTTFTNISGASLQKQNFGQDMPLLLNWTPSVVTTSDAGAGIGYTGLRIRGSDATRVNVTINGIPYNDSESQSTFWVDIPDIASSTQSVQIQRGVGTSTNGPGAFGATVNVQTNTIRVDPYAEFITAAGSFGTHRFTVKAGTGLLDNHWTFDAKLSGIGSDGYVERASSDLSSYYFSAGYQNEKTIVKAIAFGGSERTYQSWYGLDAPQMAINRRYNYAGAIYKADGSVQFYPNQVDDYRQNHYQLHVARELGNRWSGNVALHYTHGRGYYEEYHQGVGLRDIGLDSIVLKDTVIHQSDIVVRKWLDNHFYGATWSFHHDTDRSELVIGGAANQYGHARHFGELVWMQYAGNTTPGQEYYRGRSEKNDVNSFVKWTRFLSPRLSVFADAQYRYVGYSTAGIKDDLTPYRVSDTFNFFNPKAGLTYTTRGGRILYLSYAVANREPSRTDYLEGFDKPRSERLDNVEAGFRLRNSRYALEANYYWMYYHDQLVLTGQIDNAGYPIRSNVGRSYRTGLELTAALQLSRYFAASMNLTTSLNRNIDYVVTENNVSTTRDTQIAFSPSIIGGTQFSWNPTPDFQASWLSKYVGSQYLDNTENSQLKLDPYWIQDLRFSWQFNPAGMKSMAISLLVNNVLDVAYSSNGYVYSGQPYFFPQAGRHFLVMMTLKF